MSLTGGRQAAANDQLRAAASLDDAFAPPIQSASTSTNDRAPTPSSSTKQPSLINGKLPKLAKTQSMRRLQNEYAQFLVEPDPAGATASPIGTDLYRWIATIPGPAETPYEGGRFFIDLQFPSAYPFEAPKATFKTRIYHCNVNSQGVICLNSLRHWSPILTVASVLRSISALLSECNAEDALVGTIGEQYLHDRAEHDAIARRWTLRYAM